MNKNINIIQFADDIILMSESKDELQQMVMQLHKESQKVGLMLNVCQ